MSSKRTKVQKPESFIDNDPPGLARKPVTYMPGYGLFTTKQFSTGEFLLNYRGRSSADAVVGMFTYQFKFNEKFQYIDASDTDSGLARYVNDIDPFHAANCTSFLYTYRSTDNVLLPLIVFKATHDIKEGNLVLIISA